MKAWTWVLCGPLPDYIFGNLQIIRCTPSQVRRVKLGGETTHNCWAGEQSNSLFPISVWKFQARERKREFPKSPKIEKKNICINHIIISLCLLMSNDGHVTGSSTLSDKKCT